MAILAHLDKILNMTQAMASLEFPTLESGTVQALLSPESRVKPVIRGAKLHETKLFMPVSAVGDQAKEDEEPVLKVKGQTTGMSDTEKLLTAANQLAKICDLSETTERIHYLARQHSDMQIYVAELQSQLNEQDNNLTVLTKKAPLNEKSSKDLEQEIKREQMDIQNLEKMLSEKDEEMERLEQEIQEYQNAHLRQQAQESEDVDASEEKENQIEDEEIARLKEELSKKRKRLEECASVVEKRRKAMAEVAPKTPTRTKSNSAPGEEAFERIQEIVEDMRGLKGGESRGKVSIMMQQCYKAVEDLVKDTEISLSLERELDLISQINGFLVDTIISDQNIPDLPVWFRPSQDVVLAATIVRVLREAGGVMTLEQLKSEVNKTIQERGYSESMFMKAIYMLSMRKLAIYDRAKRNPDIRLVLMEGLSEGRKAAS
ncbi:uncharacterized protein VTP21DRAFT_9387 [Calcarisporiella thermophila]|uniref:uncharacterized protein n=1 Tax=Calcarisporiella thermophila TaxID=911321 RepID=UPI003742F545